MSVGVLIQKVDTDSKIANITSALATVMNQIKIFSDWLATQTDTQLENLGYSTTEVAQIRSAFSDLTKLQQIFIGAVAQGTSTYDFRSFVKLLWGFGG